MLLFNPRKARNNKLHICLDFLTTLNMRVIKDKDHPEKPLKFFHK